MLTVVKHSHIRKAIKVQYIYIYIKTQLAEKEENLVLLER